MIKIAFILVLTTVMLIGSWIPSMSFDVSGDSTKTDTNFERDDKREVVIDKKQQKIYYDFTPTTKMNFYSAWNYCKDMNYLGRTDWRVPAKDEFRTLLELGRSHITIKHAFKNVKRGIYWSSTEDRYEKSWYFDLDLGRYSVGDNFDKYYVLCVTEEKIMKKMSSSENLKR